MVNYNKALEELQANGGKDQIRKILLQEVVKEGYLRYSAPPAGSAAAFLPEVTLEDSGSPVKWQGGTPDRNLV
jgi:hypothetical protein